MKPCDDNIKAAIKLSEEMIDHAMKGINEREDDECTILYGAMLDSAYQIKQIAESEKEKHFKKGDWNYPIM